MVFNERNLRGLRAPEFPDNLTWFNPPSHLAASLADESRREARAKRADGLKLKDLKRNVVLVDFWTYSCVNCIRALPYLKQWHERYKDHGLVIVGIHSPEFEFEKDSQNIEKAIKQFDIQYPVVSDAKHQIWNLYHNAFWPRKLLIDSGGTIVHDHVGEGGYEEIELAIQKELNKIAFEPVKFPEPIPDKGAGGVCYPTTPEYYLGSFRGHYGNPSTSSGQAPSTDSEQAPSADSGSYNDDKSHDKDTAYLQGIWQIEPEYIEHPKENQGDYLLLNFRAVEVNLVMGTKDNFEAVVEVQLDSKPLEQAIFGEDVILKDGKTLVKVKEHRMYNLIDSVAHLQGELKILVNSAGWQAFAFTFGNCAKAL